MSHHPATPNKLSGTKTKKVTTNKLSSINNIQHHKVISQLELFKWKRELVRTNTAFFNSLSRTIKESLHAYKGNAYREMNNFLRNPYDQYEPFGPFRIDDHRSMILPTKLREEFIKVKKTITGATTLKELQDIIFKYHINPYYNAIIQLDKIFRKQTVPKLKSIHPDNPKVILYKGTKAPQTLTAKRPGSLITFNEFLSTSLTPEIAIMFMGIQETKMDQVLFIIHGYESNPYIYVDWEPTRTGVMKDMKYTPYGDEYEVLLPRGCQFKIIKKYRTTDYNSYYGNIELDKHKITKLNPLYNNIDNVNNSFFDRKEVKSILESVFDILVIELEYITTKPAKLKPISLDTTSGFQINFSKYIKATHASPDKSSKDNQKSN